MSLAQDPLRIGLGRLFTSQGVHPYDEVVWERRDARITNHLDGSVAFEQADVEFPADWSQNATNIVAQKYFRGHLGAPDRESSLRQVVDRVVDTITRWGFEGGYFSDDAEASAFSDELKYILVTQRAAFNSPVWFNIGVPGVPQQASGVSAVRLARAHTGRTRSRSASSSNATPSGEGDRRSRRHANCRNEAQRSKARAPHAHQVGPSARVTADHLVWRAGAFEQRGVRRAGGPRNQATNWSGIAPRSGATARSRPIAISEAALAGWLQGDGFVGQYATGTNRH